MDASPRVRRIAGVDEAGLGPLLGPLVLGFAVFETREPNLWRALEACVASDVALDRERFVVADSKLVFNRTERGERRLEATALGFLSLLEPGRAPLECARTLVNARPVALAPTADDLAPHPWFQRLRPELPRFWGKKVFELRVERLWRAMVRAEVKLVDAGVRVVPEASLNRSFRATSNKSTTTWLQTGAVLRHLWERHAEGGLRLVVDRQGGRYHYGALLGVLFPEANVVLVRERPALSEYTVRERRGERAFKLVFAEKAERKSFPVALASCFAKYTRETCMRAFNAYFAELDPTLAPTAGYTTDGRRWLADAEDAIARAGVERELLVRER